MQWTVCGDADGGIGYGGKPYPVVSRADSSIQGVVQTMLQKNSFLVMTVLASSLASFGATAEEQMAPMVVTASRIEQSTLEAPSNVSVVTSTMLEDSGADSISEALSAKVPGFYMRNGTGITTRAPFQSMRGQSQGRVKMLVDGMNLADGNTGGLSSLTTIDVNDVERIEVVHGIGSALYGSDAIGGVVNVITKSPTRQEISAKYTRGFGDGQQNEYSATYRNRWQNGFGLSIGARFNDVAGYAKKEAVVLPVGTAGTGANAVQGGIPTTTPEGKSAFIVGDKGAAPAHAGSLNLRASFDLNAQSRLYAGIGRFESQTNYSNFNNYLTKNGAPAPLPSANTSINGVKVNNCSTMGAAIIKESCFWNSSSPNQREETRYYAGYDGKLGSGFDFKANASYFDRESSYVSAGTGATFEAGPGTRNSTPNTTLELTTQLGFKLAEQHYLIAGLASNEARQRSSVSALSSWRNPDSTTGVNEESNGDSRTRSLFVQDQIFVGEALTFYVGGRYDHWTTSGVTKKFVGAPTGIVDSPERSEGSFSPKLAAVYRLNESLTVRSSIGKAFRAPTNFEMYAAPLKMGTRLLASDPDLKPETAVSWDFGIEQALVGDGSLKAAIYRTHLDDLIYRKTSPYSGTVPGVTTEAKSINAGKAQVQGIELSASFPLTSWLGVAASYAYTDSEITKDESGAGYEGKRLRYVPKNMGSLAFDTRWQQWQAYLSTTYTGVQFSDEANSDTFRGVPDSVSNYWRTNLHVSYRFDKNFKASLKVNNLFDKKYYETDLMPGRNAAIELTASF